MARIELHGVGHDYGGEGHWALAPLDHVFDDGAFLALLGPSGCGKTTLLKILSGLLRPTVGRVMFDGRDVTDIPPAARNIAQVFQFPVVYDAMTVFQNLAFPLQNRGVARSEVRRRVLEVAELCDLTAELDTRAQRLDAYAQQRVSLGRGLVRQDVAAILLDEPLTALDPQQRFAMRDRLREVHQKLRRTLVYVTHDQSEALAIADSVAVVLEGRLQQQAAPAELFEYPATTFVGDFIGSPGMNFLPVVVCGTEAVLEDQRTPLPSELAASARAVSQALTLGIRPEHVELVEPQADAALAAEVVAAEDRGHSQVLDLRLAASTRTLRVTTFEARPEAGHRCWIRFPPERVRLFADGRLLG